MHGVNKCGKPELVRPEVARAKLSELVANFPPCLRGVTGLQCAHYWAPEFAKFGHAVRLMALKFVVCYRMSGRCGKNDAADVAAKIQPLTMTRQ